MARRSDHSKAELEKIIFEAANKLVDKDGLAGLSARKLATAIGYTPGTIYSFYENLNDLILQINGKTLEQIYSKLEKASSNTKSVNKSIKAIAESYLDYAQKNNKRWRCLYEFSHPEKTKLPDWYQERINKIFDLLDSRLESHCKNSKNDLQAKVLWSGLHGIAMLSLSGKLDSVKVKSTEELMNSFIDIFLKGLN